MEVLLRGRGHRWLDFHELAGLGVLAVREERGFLRRGLGHEGRRGGRLSWLLVLLSGLVDGGCCCGGGHLFGVGLGLHLALAAQTVEGGVAHELDLVLGQPLARVVVPGVAVVALDHFEVVGLPTEAVVLEWVDHVLLGGLGGMLQLIKKQNNEELRRNQTK